MTQWVEALRRPSDLITVIVALSEFTSEQVPVVLEEGLQIDELSDAEISAALALVGATGFGGDSLPIGRTFGVRTSFESQLFVDEIPGAESAKDQGAREDALARAQQVLLGLRVFKAGRVGSVGFFEYGTAEAGGGGATSGSLTRFFGWPANDPYVLTTEGASSGKASDRHIATE